MKILFFGDSNTYGYDPADFWEMRYPREKRWTYLLKQMDPKKWEILPEGLNGRQIPNLKYDAARVLRLLNSLQQGDLFAVMLGTNDILLTTDPDADIAIEKMRRLLEFLTAQKDPSDILVIAPPHIGGAHIRDPLYQQYYRESKRMNAGFKELTQSLRDAKLAKERRLAIEAECAEAILMIESFRADFELAVHHYLQSHIEVFSQALSGMDSALVDGNVDLFISSANAITEKLGQRPQFRTMEEFEDLIYSDKNLKL